MLTNLLVKNFKRRGEVEIEDALGFSFVGARAAQQWTQDCYCVMEEEPEPIGYAANLNFAIACR